MMIARLFGVNRVSGKSVLTILRYEGKWRRIF
jgi:hypothetical protein